jgi:hypothetical protein
MEILQKILDKLPSLFYNVRFRKIGTIGEYHMKIEITANENEIREAFAQKFLLTWEEFQIEYRDFLDRIREKNHEFHFENALMWDKMPKTYQTPTFSEALNLLKRLQGEVYFIAEPGETLRINKKTYPNFVAKANATALADLIEADWYESWKAENYLYLEILPPDLYVFDAEMKHMLVFTHENDLWESELTEPMKSAAARVCLSYGFTQET